MAGASEVDTVRKEVQLELERVLEQFRLHRDVSRTQLEASGAAFGRYWDVLCRLHGHENNHKFEATHRADYHLLSHRLAAVHHPQHNAWPVLAGLRSHVLPQLLRRLNDGSDPWVTACTVIPALLSGDDGLALRLYRELERHDFHRELVRQWAEECLVAYPKQNNVAATTRFVDQVGWRSWPPPFEPVTTARSWALRIAVMPSPPLDPRVALEAPCGSGVAQLSLEGDWSITDEESAQNMLVAMFTGGHRGGLSRDLRAFGPSSNPARAELIASERRKLESLGIAAWDYCRLIALARNAVAAGYLNTKDGWRWVMRCARALQAEYGSFADVAAAYRLGMRYHLAPDVAAEHAARAEWLATSPHSPWRGLRWEEDLSEELTDSSFGGES